MTPYRAILGVIALERFAWYCFVGSFCYLWGDGELVVNHDEFGGNEGTYVEVDGRVLYNDLVTVDGDEAIDQEDSDE